MSDPPSLSELSVALHRHADVAAMTDVLTTSLAGLLPPDVVTVERQRSVGDRLAGRPGTPVSLTFDAGDRRLTLRADRFGRPEGVSEHVVRGVRLSRQTLDVDEWIAALAAEVHRLADADERAREVVTRFLLG
ncbi:hypothetical protein [Jatrophihabitans endophyticus]|uniref:hypothetical protein n=1 Tax=Jatrophihabitans endophyticus TaxID=1206085 RepID=UPI001A07ED09|nr:hypothetical protein [Jatrophihabitans endophyticus]MBE7189020.1 hypothetical protein [Jatrophihabitans endophyticus]